MRINTKICIKCSERKPEDQFNEYEPGKKRNICKTCQRSHNVNWETENQRRHEAGLESYPEVKTCYKCKTEKTRDHFTKDWTRKDGLYSLCKNCCSLKTQRIYKRYKDKEDARHYNWNIKGKYGITIEQKKEMFEQQNSCCAICGAIESGRKANGKEVAWPIDHDHKTGKVRAVLCHPCNITIGAAKEDISRLLKIAEYLKKHSSLSELVLQSEG